MVGTAGVGKIAALVNEADATDKQVPSVAVTVYDVPATVPVITAFVPTTVPTTTVPAGLNV